MLVLLISNTAFCPQIFLLLLLLPLQRCCFVLASQVELLIRTLSSLTGAVCAGLTSREMLKEGVRGIHALCVKVLSRTQKWVQGRNYARDLWLVWMCCLAFSPVCWWCTTMLTGKITFVRFSNIFLHCLTRSLFVILQSHSRCKHRNITCAVPERLMQDCWYGSTKQHMRWRN